MSFGSNEFQNEQAYNRPMRARFTAPPVLIALMTQGLAFIAAYLLILIVNKLFSTAVPLPLFLLLMGTCAFFICIFSGMAPWWRYIHLLFPLSIWAALLLDIPATYFFFGFIVFGGLFWSVFLTQVPFYPSKPEVWHAVAQLLPGQKIRILEIGSGLGNFGIHVAKFRPESQVEGIEIAPLPYLFSICQAWIRKSRAQFRLGSYEHVDFGQYELIFAYLSPAAMPALWQKAQAEMKEQSLLVSHEFPVPNQIENQKIDFNRDNKSCYVYQIGSNR